MVIREFIREIFFINHPLIHRSCYIHSMVMRSSSFNLWCFSSPVACFSPLPASPPARPILHLSLMAHTNGSTATLNSWVNCPCIQQTFPLITRCLVFNSRSLMISAMHVATFHPQIYKTTMNPKSQTLAHLRRLRRRSWRRWWRGLRETFEFNYLVHTISNFQTETSKLKLQTVCKILFTSRIQLCLPCQITS